MTRMIYNIFLFCLAASLLHCQGVPKSKIYTVQGEIDPSNLGITLSHEHIMSNFGKDMETSSVYDNKQLFQQVIPYLKKLKTLGVNSIFDCTTAYFGRRPDLLKVIADSSGVQIITNTGFYGAADDRYVPPLATTANAKSIADIWTNEFENGIEESSIKPGFIKLAFDQGAPSQIDTKLFKAGLLTHLNTGLTLAVHTGDNIEAAKLQLKLLREAGIQASAWIWVHANKVADDSLLLDFAANGAWISLDGVKSHNVEEYIRRIALFKQHGLLNKVLLSHDGNGFPKGNEIRPFEAIMVKLIPEMQAYGFSKKEIDQILIKNPQNAFRIQIRKN